MAAISLRGITAGRMPKRYRRDHYSWWDVDTGFSDERAAGGAFLGNKPCSLYIPTKRTQYTKMHLGNWWSHGECDPYKYSETILITFKTMWTTTFVWRRSFFTYLCKYVLMIFEYENWLGSTLFFFISSKIFHCESMSPEKFNSLSTY